ncbi:LysR family transcriptional regulator [Nocardioides anomalus]|uniref:LysR family transcriptional regulator n=1 Tax=Nocardioides anomalus TaxID=2712223 RepID=A0A6G6WE57_9ACTN|nr:LysR family transcriptional regulator [Nocardioides anomalus]QIG43385.1 LysR family transcriptional regulator [Nocardioides anomalus]
MQDHHLADLDLTAVQSFVVLSQQRHFGRAAAGLGVTVSALTKRIQRLEAALGVPLVERDSGGYGGLTAAGRRFVEVAPELPRTAQTARLAAAGASTTTLRLGVPAGVGVVAPLLPAALATLELALRHAHPGVAVEPVPTPFPRLTPDLLSGDVDVVLTFGGRRSPTSSPPASRRSTASASSARPIRWPTPGRSRWASSPGSR